MTNIFRDNIYFRTPEGKRAVSFTIPVRTVPATPPRVNINYTDGGRVGAGFTHERNDCGVRALAILKGWTYAEAHSFWANHGRKPGKGVRWALHCKHARVERVPEIEGGSVGKVLSKLPKGRFVIRVAGHVFAVVDGVPQDTGRPKARGHVKGVYRNIPVDNSPAVA